MRSESVAEEWLAQTGNTICCSTAEDDPAWDAFVASLPGGSHVQTSMWARVKAVVHWRAVRIMLLHDETAAGQANRDTAAPMRRCTERRFGGDARTDSFTWTWTPSTRAWPG